ncbi:AKT1 [Symbiodinium natans]|uniref:AKT1 protein n=1 Tax=Symbiodinium natans TaxID=878477 RepID=A0A812QYV2_9DINO|nr:AKT1 [Symbiodinium natans]
MAPAEGGQQCFSELLRCQKELAGSLEVLQRTYGGIKGALEQMPGVWPELGAAGQVVPASPASRPESAPPTPSSQAANKVEEKYQLTKEGVPTLTKNLNMRKTPYAKSRTGTVSLGKSGVRLLDDWTEAFVISEQEATNVYTNLYGEKHQSSKQAMSSVRSSVVRKLGRQICQREAIVSTWNYIWEVITLVLVVLDTALIPITLAWPDSDAFPSPSFFYFQAGPFLWSFDILMNFGPAVLEKDVSVKLQLARRYVCSRFPIDLSLVILDVVLLLRVLQEHFRVFTLLRLIRILKLRRVLTVFENRLVAAGNMKAVPYLTILQCIATVLAVNHVLACVVFYVGRLGRLIAENNWLDEYDMNNHSSVSQYMTCFNWVIAEYTPAPFPKQPHNEMEQLLIIVIILTCLPLLGAQIGKIGGTLNTMKEKARERDMVRRDLQRFLQRKNAPTRLTRRMLTSLDDVLDSKDSPLNVKEPIALKFLPSSLLDELRVVKMSEKLGAHLLFHMLMDERLGLAGRLSAVFREVNAVQGENVFTNGKPGEGLYITQSGLFFLNQSKGTAREKSTIQAIKSESVRLSGTGHSTEGMTIQEDSWLAELCLYTGVNHTVTLTTKIYSKVLTVPIGDYVKAIRSAPAAVVAVHEYAKRLLNIVEPSKTDCWELLAQATADDCVTHTQLAELLDPGTGRVNNLKSTEEIDFAEFLDDLRQAANNEARMDVIKEYVPELREDGIYMAIGFEEEVNRAILSVLSAVWLLLDDYNSMVDCQKITQRLSPKTFQFIKEFLGSNRMKEAQLHAVLILLALRGLSKNADFAKLCPPSERGTPEKVLAYATTNLDAYLPSIASLRGDAYDILSATVRMLGAFNFAQLLQGENNPHSIWQLQGSLEDEGEEVFQTFLFVQVCLLCGVTGNITLRGSMFLSELNGRSVLKGLACLQNILGVDPNKVYWRYIASRAEALELHVQTPSHLVLARLACLTRTVEPSALRALAGDWDQLTDAERDALSEIFLSDGHYDKAFIFQYLPLFLTNAMANPGLGLRRGLQFLVELYGKLMNHRCLNQDGSTVTVDISSLATMAKDIEDLKLLRQCMDFSRIVKHGSGVTVLLTAESYQILSGQLVAEDRKVDLLEMLTAQQRRLEDAVIGRTRPMTLWDESPRDMVISDEF